jgi:predicted PurR-regulated permease PerM
MSKPPLYWYAVVYAFMALIALPVFFWYPQLIALPVISMFVAFLCYRPVMWMEAPYIGPWRARLRPHFYRNASGNWRVRFLPLLDRRVDLPFRMQRSLFGAIMVFGTLLIMLYGISVGLRQTISDIMGLQPKIETYWPVFVNWFNTTVSPLLEEYGGVEITLDLDVLVMLGQLNFLRQYAGDGLNLLTTLAGIAAMLAMTVAHLVMKMIIIAFVAFYMLLKWEAFNAAILRACHRFTPNVAAKYVTRLLDRIGVSYMELFRGQFTVCLVMALFYGTALHLAGLPLGFLIGFVSGLLCVIPIAGMVIGASLALVVTGFELQLSQGWMPYLTILGIFAAGVTLEGKFLAPYIIGRKLKLSDAWVYLGLFAGEVIGGLMGMLLVLPLLSLFNQIILTVTEAWDQRFKPEVWHRLMARHARVAGSRKP